MKINKILIVSASGLLILFSLTSLTLDSNGKLANAGGPGEFTCSNANTPSKDATMQMVAATTEKRDESITITGIVKKITEETRSVRDIVRRLADNIDDELECVNRSHIVPAAGVHQSGFHCHRV